MLDHYLRPLKDRLLDIVARSPAQRIGPAPITWLACLTGLLAAWLLTVSSYPGALALWLVSRVLDGLDGAVARASGRSSDFGGYLDIVLDFVVYAAVPIGLVLGLQAPERAWLPLALMLGAFYVNAASWIYLAAVLEKRGLGAAERGESTSIIMPPGVVGGSETIVLYSLFILLPSHAAGLFALMAILVLTGVVQRLVWAWRRL